MSKHTKGPWHVGMKPGPIVYGPQGEQVANMFVPMLPEVEHYANARLIAAAPEMYEVLEELAGIIVRGDIVPLSLAEHGLSILAEIDNSE